MDQTGLYVNIGINGIHYTYGLIDDGCHCYATISNHLANKLKLPRIKIIPRGLSQVNMVDEEAISEVTYFCADIDGHKQSRVYCYIIPEQTEDVIIGLPWIRSEDMVLRPSKNRMKIKSTGTLVRFRNPQEPSVAGGPIYNISANAFTTIARRARLTRSHSTHIFTSSIQDIEKALHKFNKPSTDPMTKLPPHFRHQLECFKKEIADKLPPHRPNVDHAIPTEANEIPWGPLYHMSKEELLVLRKTLTELLDKGFIRVSSSSAGAPVLFVRKPGGGLRFCVDYRRLNEITKKDRTPLPLITETLRQLSKAAWFTKLDVNAAFYKIRVKEGDEWKTAFRTRYGLYEWLVTPFGLTGAPATFQKYINWVLREYLDNFVTAYIDDILIYSSGSIEDHRSKVNGVLDRLKVAGLTLDIDKCEFEQKRVKYLGYVVDTEQGIMVDPDKVKAIQEWEPPTSVRGVRGFLGFANYYREFIPSFAEISRPMNALTKKEAVFDFSDICIQAFQTLKDLLIHAPVLIAFDPDRETRVEADSSGYSIGGQLCQKDATGRWRPVAFYSRKMLPPECNYPIHDKEMLSIISCLREWQSELRSVNGNRSHNQQFDVLTDHRNLEYFMQKQRLTERQVRWALDLAEFNLVMIHRPGKSAVVPDALSRRDQDLPKNLEDGRLQARVFQMLQKSSFATSQGTMDKVTVRTARASLCDVDPIRVTATWVTGGDGDDALDEEEAKAVIVKNQLSETMPKNPFDEGNNLHQLWEKGLEKNWRYWLIRSCVQEKQRQLPPKWGLPISITECAIDKGHRLTWRDRIWIPFHEPLRTTIIQKSHDSTLAGHPGRDLLKVIISRQFTWPGLAQDVRQFVRNCDVCRAAAVWREKRRGLLKPLPIPDRPWSDISIDFITDLPTVDGHSFIMVITDRLFKSVIFQPMRTIKTQSVAEEFLKCFIRHHGLPRSIVSDRGSQFLGHMWQTVCKLLRIHHRLSTSFHPETDGSTERMNQELEHYLRCFTTYAQDDWLLLLSIAMLAINARTARSTGMSPFFATHGYDIEPIQIDNATELREHGKSPIAQGEAFAAKLKQASEMAQAIIASAQDDQERQANTKRQPHDAIKIGDKVWLKLKNIQTDRPSKKLDWLNAKYEVIDIPGTHTVKLNTPPGIHPVFHVMLIQRAPEDPLPSQQRQDYQPPAIMTTTADGDEEYTVERIENHKLFRRGQPKLHIKWNGYIQPTWEPLSEFLDAKALDDYETLKGIELSVEDRLPHSPPTSALSRRRGVMSGAKAR